MNSKLKKIIGFSVLVIIVLIFTFSTVKRVIPLSWRSNDVNQSTFSDEAINGYDAAAYFTDNKAVKGNLSITHTWNNSTWYFSSEANKNLFTENPEKYSPKYGGYCAFAVSKGFTANTDPEAFEIIDDKLYLFADQGIKADWMADKNNNLKICEENWK